MRTKVGGRLFRASLAVLFGALLTGGLYPQDIDFEKARQLFRKRQSGEKLTKEEQEYLKKAIELRKKGRAGRGGKPPEKFAGATPLTAMTAEDHYKGQDGGLYGGGLNQPPPAHLKAAKKVLDGIEPVDANGKPSARGKIVLLSIGMSNTTQEFSVFKRKAESAKGPHVVIVDGAQGGRDAARWATPDAQPWGTADQRLKQAGVTAKQVRVIWVKQALAGQGRHGAFPAHAKRFQKDLKKIVTIAKGRYPKLEIAYLSSRIYAGYARSNLNPEPYAYEGAFSIRWLIRDQIKGDESLIHDPVRGPVVAPLLLWGPYLWGNGTAPRKGDELVWKEEDLAKDGTHPSPSGREKVARMLLKFFTTDPLAKSWFLR